MILSRWMAQYAVAYAANDTHGYTNNYPYNQWWHDPDIDCGAFMSKCLHEALLEIGIDTGKQYFEPMGDDGIYNESFLLKYCNKYDYKKVTNRIGDILVSYGHTEMYTAAGQLTGARNDYDGKTGDGNSKEVCSSGFYNASNGGWLYIYRLKPEYDIEVSDPEKYTYVKINVPVLKKGCIGNEVKNLQALLNLWTCQDGTNEPIEEDGIFMEETETRLKLYQRLQGLLEDGIAAAITWDDLING